MIPLMKTFELKDLEDLTTFIYKNIKNIDSSNIRLKGEMF
jgi:hypothetical protein